MKKQLLAILVLTTLLLSCVGSYAQEAPQMPDWYALDEEQMLLTVTLPANATTGFEWHCEISDPEALELMSQEYIPDENKAELVGVGGTWIASFKGSFKDSCEVELKLNYQRPWEEVADETRVIIVIIHEDSTLEVVSAERTFPLMADEIETAESK